MDVTLPERKIAYFSMEIGIDSSLPTYSGGLGILAGDTLKAAADLGVPVIGVTLLAEKGYFTQTLDQEGNQHEQPTQWEPQERMAQLPNRITVQVEGRDVQVRAWQYNHVGSTGYSVPILFLDTNLPENGEWDRTLTSFLYGGDQRYRIAQEIVLGIGGVRMLQALGCVPMRYHMNEGHASFLALELFYQDALNSTCPLDDFGACMANSMSRIRKLCVFTTHTPVAAGHDQFPYDLVRQVLGEAIPIDLIQQLAGKERLNMTLLALNLSHYVNSVARQHMHVSTHLFPGYHFSSITNGVHSATWVAEPMSRLFDTHVPHWRQDSFDLRHALRIPEAQVWEAHQESKRRLIEHLNREHNAGFDAETFTIGFARRATAYKRMLLLFQDLDRLRRIGQAYRIQLVFAGKAHPRDLQGKDLIRQLHQHIKDLAGTIRIVYVPDYDIRLARLIIPGVDIWLNTPARPQEASGTSGMKAAHNGVPHLSVLDGWWVEGHIEGITGWSIGPYPSEENESVNDDDHDAQELYDKLEHTILPMYYERRSKWLHVMRNSIALNASYFNTHRMMQQYVLHAYLF